MGSATALVHFSRSIGGTLGVTVMGAIATRDLRGDPDVRGPLPEHLPLFVRHQLAVAVRPAFLFAACVCVAALVLVVFGLREEPLRRLGRGAAPRIRDMSARDPMPLLGWDHVELWVGNAQQSAYYYEHAFGFRRHAYAGPETGMRDRASYVLRQGEVRSRADERARFRQRDLALRVHARGRRARHRDDGARRRARRTGSQPSVARAACASPSGSRTSTAACEISSIATYGEVVHSFVARSDYAGPLPARLRGGGANGRDTGVGLTLLDHCVGNVELGKMDEWVALVRAGARLREHRPLRRRADSHRVLGADVEGDGGRRREDQVPDQRARRGPPQEPDRRVPRVQRRAGRAARRDPDRRHRPTVEALQERGVDFLRTPETYYEDAFRARRRDRRSRGATCGGSASSSTATRTGTCSRSSRSRCRTGRRSSSR